MRLRRDGGRAATAPPGPSVVESAADLLAALGSMPDPRARRGVRHALVTVVAAAVRAFVAGYRSYAAIEFTGFGTSPTTKTDPRSAPAPDPRSWQPYAAVGALRLTGVTNIAANRHHARDSNRPLALLGIT
jgi:hypothetical protein